MITGINYNKTTFASGALTAAKASALTNKAALRLMADELSSGMQKSSINYWIKQLQKICQRLKIEPKRLPINNNHPGNLTDVERLDILSEIFDLIIHSKRGKQITLIV